MWSVKYLKVFIDFFIVLFFDVSIYEFQFLSQFLHCFYDYRKIWSKSKIERLILKVSKSFLVLVFGFLYLDITTTYIKRSNLPIARFLSMSSMDFLKNGFCIEFMIDFVDFSENRFFTVFWMVLSRFLEKLYVQNVVEYIVSTRSCLLCI